MATQWQKVSTFAKAEIDMSEYYEVRDVNQGLTPREREFGGSWRPEKLQLLKQPGGVFVKDMPPHSLLGRCNHDGTPEGEVIHEKRSQTHDKRG
jgi:hypothetical protein